MEIDKNILCRYLSSSAGKDTDLADIFIEDWQTLNIQMRDREFKSITPGASAGLGIRLVKDMQTYYVSTSDVTEKGLASAAGEAKNISALNSTGRNIVLKENKLRKFDLAGNTFSVSLQDKLDYIKRGSDFAWNYSDKIVQVIAGYYEYLRKITLLNLDGDFIREDRNITEFKISVVVRDQGRSFISTDGFGVYDDASIFIKHKPEDIARSVCDVALTMLYAKPSPAGEMTVVVGNGSGGTGAVFHEACGHGLEADFIRKGISVYRDKVGKAVASPIVSIIDDPTIEKKKGSFVYDDEGTPGQKTYAIEKGVLKNYLSDRLSGKFTGKCTGNGRRENFRYMPIPRQSNLYLDSGPNKAEEIIESVKKGLYVKSVGGGIVDSAKGDFSFNVHVGYIIENGKLTQPVRGAVLTGNGPKVLREIDMIADDLEFSSGLGGCGKVNQFVPADMGCPTLRIPAIIVGGTEKR